LVHPTLAITVPRWCCTGELIQWPERNQSSHLVRDTSCQAPGNVISHLISIRVHWCSSQRYTQCSLQRANKQPGFQGVPIVQARCEDATRHLSLGSPLTQGEADIVSDWYAVNRGAPKPRRGTHNKGRATQICNTGETGDKRLTGYMRGCNSRYAACRECACVCCSPSGPKFSHS
jgi:hypothetical protein